MTRSSLTQLEARDSFIPRHIGPSDTEQAAMLATSQTPAPLLPEELMNPPPGVLNLSSATLEGETVSRGRAQDGGRGEAVALSFRART